MAVFTETIEMKDGVSPVAKAAKTALLDMTRGLEAAQASIIKAGALGDKAGFQNALADVNKYKHGIDSLKNSKLPGTQAPANDNAGDAGKSMTDMWSNASHAAQVGKESIGAAISDIGNAFRSLAAGDVKGAVTGLFDAVADVSKMLDLVVPGLGQAVSAVIKIAGGIAGITAGLIQSGIQFAVVTNQEEDAAIRMYDALGKGAITGKEVKDMVDEMSDSLGLADTMIEPLAKSFLKMGITGKDALQQMTLAALSANAIVGEGGAEAFTNLQKKIQLAAETGGKFKLGAKQLLLLREAGSSVTDVAEEMGMKTEDLAKKLESGSVDAKEFGDALTNSLIKKGAPALEKLSQNWKNIMEMFDKSIGDMFKGMSPEVDALMKEVKDFFAVFQQANPSGQALKEGIQAFFKEALTLAAQLVPMVKHFLLDIIIYGLQAYIALKPTVQAVKDFLASTEGIAAKQMVWDALKMALMGIGIAIGIVVGLFAILVTASIVVGTAIWAVIGTILSLAATITTTLMDLGATALKAGIDFVAGLISGITSGFSLVTDTVSSLADTAVGAFKSALGIASPSKVMMELGAHTGTGFNMGLGQAANDTYGAAGQLSQAVVDGAQGGNVAPQSASGGGASNVFYITIEGGSSSAQEIAEEVVARVNERMAQAAGA